MFRFTKKAKKNRSSVQNHKSRTNRFESLERRELMAANAFNVAPAAGTVVEFTTVQVAPIAPVAPNQRPDISNADLDPPSVSLNEQKILVITGSNRADAGDFARVDQFKNWITVTLRQTDAAGNVIHNESRLFRRNEVNSIIYSGNAGDDRFENHTNLLSSASGGNGKDFLQGGSFIDNLFGGAGRDTIYGGDGRDHLDGGTGSDLIDGQGGDDDLFGKRGNDTLHGGAGGDRLFGGVGNDTMFGGAGNDKMLGESGNDRMYGDEARLTNFGGGNDNMDGGSGHDKLYGQSGNDTIKGGSGRDKLYGQIGNDTLKGGSGNDQLYGQSGRDRLFGNSGKDRLFGGYGDDYLNGGKDGKGDDLRGQQGKDTFISFKSSFWKGYAGEIDNRLDYNSGEGDRLKSI